MALAAIGTGMTIGTFVGGWGADRNAPRTMITSFVALILTLAVYLAVYLAVASSPAGLFASVLLVGFWFSAMNPPIQARFIHITREAELMGAAVSHAAFNIGNALGAFTGGLLIAAGFGYLAPGAVAILLTAGGLAFTLASLALSRRDRLRGVDTTGVRVP